MPRSRDERRWSYPDGDLADFRLQLFEKSPHVPVMQFVLPGIQSVFINSAVESGFALQGDKFLEMSL